MDNGEPGWGSRRPVWNSWKPGWDSGELRWTMESLVGAVDDLCRTVGSLGKTLLILCGIVRILSVAVGIPDGTGGVICQEIPTISLTTCMIHCNVFILLFFSTAGKVQVPWVQA